MSEVIPTQSVIRNRKAQDAIYYQANRDKIKSGARARYANNRESRKIYMAEYRKRRPDIIKRLHAKSYQKTKVAVLERQRLKKYGVTKSEVDSMLVAQLGLCAICRIEMADGDVCVDHCHSTKVVRGLLCHNCNLALGLLEDSPERFRLAACYLEKKI